MTCFSENKYCCKNSKDYILVTKLWQNALSWGNTFIYWYIVYYIRHEIDKKYKNYAF